MNLPSDPIMLMSVLNTELRDHYSSLDALCKAGGIDKNEIVAKLAEVNYFYDEKRNAFI